MSMLSLSSFLLSFASSIVLSPWFGYILSIYFLVETLFYISFSRYFLPRANQLVEPAPYRDYGHDRCKLLLRIAKRIEDSCCYIDNDNIDNNNSNNNDDDDETKMKKKKKLIKKQILKFISEWFHVPKMKTIKNENENDASNNINNNDNININTKKNGNPKVLPKLLESTATTDGEEESSSASVTTTFSSPDSSDTEMETNTSTTNKTAMTTESQNKINRNDDDDDDDDDDDTPILYKNGVDEFFAWAFFGKRLSDFLPWERDELQKLYVELERETGVTFPNDYPKTTTTTASATAKQSATTMTPQQKQSLRQHFYVPRCMTLEPLNAFYRPLFIYLLVIFAKCMAGIFLYSIGFRRYVSKTGLVGWHRPALSTNRTNNNNNNHDLSHFPMLFFHGIAPGGLFFYIPMILFGLNNNNDDNKNEKDIRINGDRPIFLFENKSISCCLDFHPLTEEQTVDGVVEILKRCNCYDDKNDDNNNDKTTTTTTTTTNISSFSYSLVGHSFGSCPITWVLASKKLPKHCNVQVTLVDPVAILLSEPDVMVNFLYAEELDRIRMVASSELFTEHYLRRHFAWYNSEFWLEDFIVNNNNNNNDDDNKNNHHHYNSCQVLVCLSEKDEIVNTPKVEKEMKRLQLDSDYHLLVWKNVGHAACVTSPTMWKQIQQRMIRQHSQILQQQQFTVNSQMLKNKIE